MSKQSHTPEGWKVVQETGVETLTGVIHCSNSKQAHLIAAAPEMLKTLESAREALCALGGSDEAIELIDSVMVKARGES